MITTKSLLVLSAMLRVFDLKRTDAIAHESSTFHGQRQMGREMRTIAGVLLGVVVLLLAIPGTAVAISASPMNVNFGDVPLGTTVTQEIIIDLDSNSMLYGAGGVDALNPPFDFDGGTCGWKIIGGTCIIKESFTPSTTGSASATLALNVCPVPTTNSCGQTIFIELSGNGVETSIPEFPTVALPVIAVIGLMFLFQRRKTS